MKKFLLLGAAIAALNFSTPIMANDNQTDAETSLAEKGANELDVFTKLFGNMFPKDDTPIEPALLAKSERIAGALVPAGSYRKIMAETFQKVVGPMMDGIDQVPLSTIAVFAGVPEDNIALKDGATTSDVMTIIDPHYKQRNRAMMTSITDVMIDLSDEIEPSIRAGMARAYARRFSASELEAAAEFYETEAGAKIAGESLAIFTSPEVMSASMEMMPKFMERFFGVMEEITNGSDSLPPPRKFGDLGEDDLRKMSELMGVDRESMGGSGFEAVETALAEAADPAADEFCSEDDECYSEAQGDLAADPGSWSARERETVAKLEAEHQIAFEKYFAAQEAATENARKRLQKD
jgi:hypothetical protein